MTLRDITNLDLSLKAQASIATKYAPIIQCRKFIHEQVSRSTFLQKWQVGDMDIDLWLDNSLYPHNPSTWKQPKLNPLKDLVEFVGDGENDSLEYVRLFQSQNHECT